MTSHEVTYQGPPSHVVRAATLLAEAEGIELTSAGSPEQPGSDGMVRLAVTVEGTDEAVVAAVEAVSANLPAEATLTVSG